MRNYKSGQAVLTAVIFLVLLSVVVTGGLVSPLVRQAKTIGEVYRSRLSYYTAESGIEDAVYRIKQGLNYSDNYTLSANDAEASIEVTTSGNTRTIESIGDYLSGLRLLRTSLFLSSVTPQFYYGAQAGEGGVTMGNGAQIAGAGGAVGNLYSNGPVYGFDGGLGSTVTGDVIVATGVVLAGQSTACTNDQIVGQNNPEIDFAQSFRAEGSEPLAKISLYLKRAGSGNPPSANIRIVADNGGSPASQALATASLDSNLVTGNYGWIEVVFSEPATLVNNQTYWIVLDAGQSSSKYWVWCKDSNNGYGNGVAKYKQDWSSVGTWAAVEGDLTFKAYLGSGFSVLDNIYVYGTAKANDIVDSKICGDAYYQSIDDNSTSFLNGPSNPCPTPYTPGAGYGNQADPPVSPLPISEANIDQWKSDAEAGGVCTEPVCDENGNFLLQDDTNLGPKKITGDLTLDANGKTLTLTGTIYAQGDLDISNNSTIQCDSGYNNSSCVLVIDGRVTVGNGALFNGSGQPGSYILILSTKAYNESDPAIELNNNALGVILYANNGLIRLNNNVSATEITGYKLDLDQGVVVTYEQGLFDADFTNGPGASFQITDWEEF